MHNPFVPETLEGWSVLHLLYRVRWDEARMLSQADCERIGTEARAALDSRGDGHTAFVQMLGHKADFMVIVFRRTFDALGQAQLNLSRSQLGGYLELMQELNLDVAGEFLVMAATLIHLKSRTLLLPMWKDVTLDQYDLLIGHEVGHALYSDDLSYIEDCKVQPGLHTFVNVLEDVRIEKRVKDAFPGMRSVFARGYRDFYEHGPLFQLDRPIAEYSFIDRVNMYFKGGFASGIKFSPEEIPFVRRIEAAETFADVIAMTDEVYGFAKERGEEEAEQQALPDMNMDDMDMGDDFSDEDDEDVLCVVVSSDAKGLNVASTCIKGMSAVLFI